MRLGLILGLNHNTPERQCINPIEREHRVRIWWAVYIFDRMWGSKTGFPLQIRDEDIHVDMPTELQLNTAVAAEQFSDTAYLVASVQLARIVGQIVEKIYSRKEQGGGVVPAEAATAVICVAGLDAGVAGAYSVTIAGW